MKYYLALKRNALSCHENKQTNLKWILLNQRAHLKRLVLYNSNYMTLWNGKNIETVKDQWLPGVHGEGASDE